MRLTGRQFARTGRRRPISTSAPVSRCGASFRTRHPKSLRRWTSPPMPFPASATSRCAARCCKARSRFTIASITFKVLPESAIARLGSETHPKGYQQFEAIGLSARRRRQAEYRRRCRTGPGRRDVVGGGILRRVTATTTRNFVGTLSPTGFFTPASDGPNPKRKFSRNNYGDVWVVATAEERKGQGRQAAGRANRIWWSRFRCMCSWDQPEVGQ